VEGLKLVPNSKNMAFVYAKPGADLSKYDRVYLTAPYDEARAVDNQNQ